MLVATAPTSPLQVAARELEYLTLLLAVKSSDAYRRELRNNARALWNGTWSEFDFFLAMLTTIRRHFTQAFFEGAATCGITPGELTRAEMQRLEDEIMNEKQYIDGLADFISANSKAMGGLLKDVFTRVELWVNGFQRIKTLAQTLACGDLKYKWQLGPRLVHCRDCKKLNGRTYRGSVWAKYDIYPRHWSLECRGVHCGCGLEKTDEPVTPGFPPKLTYQ